MRKQYHFRNVGGDVLIWDVDRLVALATSLPRKRIPLSAIREIDESYWFEATQSAPTCRAVFEHARLIRDADLSFPVILSCNGRVMDGMHRIGKAFVEGCRDIEIVQFVTDPEPDYANVDPSELPY